MEQMAHKLRKVHEGEQLADEFEEGVRFLRL